MAKTLLPLARKMSIVRMLRKSKGAGAFKASLGAFKGLWWRVSKVAIISAHQSSVFICRSNHSKEMGKLLSGYDE